ncbi:MAG TPA: hypothetical protein VGR69_08940 [Candidatus Rubrimentiphilum sp.]|nr:hypothetical protein [Candidatus Rubrimentiphilum sp.]
MRIAVQVYRDGTVSASHPSRTVHIRRLKRLDRATKIVGSKELSAHLDRHIPNPKKAHTPAPNHPWKQPQNSLARGFSGHF